MTYKDIKEFNSEDVEFINFAYSLINSARYPSFEKVTTTYNKIFNVKLNNTSCGSCIRQRILEMKSAIDQFYEKELGCESSKDEKEDGKETGTPS